MISAGSIEAAVAELQRRVDSVHERVPCPACKRPTGLRCVRKPRANSNVLDGVGVPLKHPHRERLRADGIPLR